MAIEENDLLLTTSKLEKLIAKISHLCELYVDCEAICDQLNYIKNEINFFPMLKKREIKSKDINEQWKLNIQNYEKKLETLTTNYKLDKKITKFLNLNKDNFLLKDFTLWMWALGNNNNTNINQFLNASEIAEIIEEINEYLANKKNFFINLIENVEHEIKYESEIKKASNYHNLQQLKALKNKIYTYKLYFENYQNQFFSSAQNPYHLNLNIWKELIKKMSESFSECKMEFLKIKAMKIGNFWQLN